MTMSEASQHTPKPVLTALGLIIGLYLMSALAGRLIPEGGVPPLGAQRAQERKTALEELRAKSAEQLAGYGVVSEANEVYRIPIDRAMKIIVQEWANPDEGRQKMLARSEKAFPAPPPTPAAAGQQSPYE